jgi:hypothetical protein
VSCGHRARVQPPAQPEAAAAAGKSIEDIRASAIAAGRASHHGSDRSAYGYARQGSGAYLHDATGVAGVAPGIGSAHDLTPSALPGQNRDDRGHGAADPIHAKADTQGSLADLHRRGSAEHVGHGSSEKERAQHEQDVRLHMEIDAAKRADKAAAASHR